ncbi:Co-chaperone Hsc20 [Peniophora sp. CONT]|nr:Co-chaperone Hsc20 [Peniophora sp. CONT]
MFSFSARLAYTRPAALRTLRSARLYSAKSIVLPTECPSCGTPLPTRLPACPKCRFIQRIPDDYDYYDLLRTNKYENPFQLNKGNLRRSFLDLQRHIHPDVWAPHGDDKVDVARDLSGIVNKAYNTLLSPLSRAQYILREHGLDVSETDQVEDPELLMGILESREALEEAQAQSDVDAIREENAGRIDTVVNEIDEHIGAHNWEAAHKAAVKLKYLESIEHAAKSWPAASFDH